MPARQAKTKEGAQPVTPRLGESSSDDGGQLTNAARAARAHWHHLEVWVEDGRGCYQAVDHDENPTPVTQFEAANDQAALDLAYRVAREAYQGVEVRVLNHPPGDG